ncbi:hypothetical protein PBI_PATTYP_88 [Mycobacterium phage PattyP]|uniref:hypothetical protein n=1 Tax=Mycobacterium phage PattyP TaxID=1327773 RepID=UPI00032B8897|nr:hypothetical protein PBI_PATTYP_88 [Mycobacterium phage PattyP]AGK87375.1 hypothetical protein PBI_PATTYP_88 [Mycobacterium phage PattyP]
MRTNATAVSRALNSSGLYTSSVGRDTYGVFVHRHVDGAQITVNGRTPAETENLIDLADRAPASAGVLSCRVEFIGGST